MGDTDDCCCALSLAPSFASWARCVASSAAPSALASKPAVSASALLSMGVRWSGECGLLTMAESRTQVLKLPLSDAELEAVRTRAQVEPAVVWLRRLVLDGAPPAEASPALAELTRAAVLAGNHLHPLTEALAVLDRLDSDLTSTSELARC